MCSCSNVQYCNPSEISRLIAYIVSRFMKQHVYSCFVLRPPVLIFALLTLLGGLEEGWGWVVGAWTPLGSHVYWARMDS